MATRPRANLTELQMASMGANGADWIDDTEEHIGDWHAITAFQTSVFDALEGEELYSNGQLGTFSTRTLPVGMTVYGRFTKITLTSGEVYAVKL